MLKVMLCVLQFVQQNFDWIIAGTWAAGFGIVSFRQYYRWCKEDAMEARCLYPGDVGIMEREMARMKRERRGERLKWLATSGLFWPIALLINLGRGAAKLVFYPVLAGVEKTRTVAIAEGTKQADKMQPNSGKVMCNWCKKMVGMQEEHRCRGGGSNHPF